MENAHFILNPLSKNAKTGLGVAVSTSDSRTCPSACPLKDKQCYARFGNTSIHWKRLNDGKRGVQWAEFVDTVKALPRGWKFRHNEAGDLPGEDNEIDTEMLASLAMAVKERELRAWSYSHKPLTSKNVIAIKSAIADGFTINISADTTAEADEARSMGLPTVLIVAKDTKNGTMTPGGNKIILCPNQTHGKTCAECMLCQKANRTCIVGFIAHGTASKSLNMRVLTDKV